MEMNLQILHSSGCLLLTEEILQFSRSVLSRGVGYVLGIRLYLHRVCWILALTLRNSAALYGTCSTQLKSFLTLSSAILSACMSSLLLPSENNLCWPNLCPTSLSILSNYCCWLLHCCDDRSVTFLTCCYLAVCFEKGCTVSVTEQ
jgi:hypothetical protein